MGKASSFWVLVLVLGAAVGASGCSAINDFSRYVFGDGPDAGPGDGGPSDGGPQDAGPDGGEVDGGADAGPPAPRGPTSVVQTSGGAVIRTAEYRLRVSVGAPQPIGEGQTSAHRIRTGPVSR